MLYILYGEDDFSLYQALERIKADLGNPDMLAASTVRLDGGHLSLSELRQSCDVAPFLSPQRLVIVNGLLERFEPGRSKSKFGKRIVKSANEPVKWQDMASYTERVPETTVLVLCDGKISVNNPLLKKLCSIAKVTRFPLLRGSSLKAWIRLRVSSENGNISSRATDLLAELIGGNLWALNSEIQKLLIYTRERTIGEDDVRQLVSHVQEASIFPLVDAIIENQPKTAQELLHRLYQEGVSPTHILTMINRQLRLIVLSKELSGLSHQQIQDRLGLPTRYSLDKTLHQANMYDLERVREAYGMVLEADLAIKTGKYRDQLAVELLVSELSSCRN
jgi:DNA polymerase III subunit delta